MASDKSVSQTCLDEKFKFLNQAGKGTYGTTWVALDRESGSKVVVKAISKQTTSRVSFKKEFKYSRLLSDHPSIIYTHDSAYETKTSYVLVQDFAEGGDLFDAIQPEVGLSESKARKVLRQVAQALEYMHSKKLVHRDVKPENVVMTEQGGTGIKLIDFGMTLRSGAHVSKVCGSIPYTPPEICSASGDLGFYVHSSCDVWSVGVLLFCMLTGSFPWEQATLNDPNFYEFAMWQTGVSSSVPYLWRNFSPRLLELFSKLLCIDPQKRSKISEVYHYLNDPWLNSTHVPVCLVRPCDSGYEPSLEELGDNKSASESKVEEEDVLDTVTESQRHMCQPWTHPASSAFFPVSAC